MDSIAIIGFIAGTLTTISFFPQLIKIWKSKSTKDISTGMFVTLCVGIFFWIIYGIAIHSLPVIITNGVTFVLAFIILLLKIKYDR